MKIAHINIATLDVLHPRGGAIQRRVLEIARQQTLMGHEVTILSVGPRRQSLRIGHVDVWHIPCTIIRGPMRHLEFQVKVTCDLRRLDKAFDVLHFHSEPEAAVTCASVQTPKVLTYDNYLFRGGRQTPLYLGYQYALNRFDALLPVSQYCREGSIQYWNLPREKVKVVYNGVNLEQFAPDLYSGHAEREGNGLKGPVVLYVGRVCTQKGTDVLLEAMRILKTSGCQAQLAVAGPIGQFGTVTDDDFWQQRIEAIGGKYLGAVDETRLAGIYNMADVFVMPTKELEMFGMAAVEAQACGKPVIASDHGGLRETVPLECGGRFPVGDSAGLAQQIDRLLKDRFMYDECAKFARQNASRFSWERICTSLEEVYQTIL